MNVFLSMRKNADILGMYDTLIDPKQMKLPSVMGDCIHKGRDSHRSIRPYIQTSRLMHKMHPPHQAWR